MDMPKNGPKDGYVRLRAPDGAWEGPTFGGEQYELGPDGLVEVPAEAAVPLLRVGGFILWTDEDS